MDIDSSKLPYTPPLHQQYRPPLEKLKPWCTTTMYFKYVAYNSSQSHWVVTGVAGGTNGRVGGRTNRQS